MLATDATDLIVTDRITFQTAATNTRGGNLSVMADEITLSAAVSTGGGDVSLSATGNVTLDAPFATSGGGLTVLADSDGDGAGTFTTTAAVMTEWSEQQKLAASDTARGDYFGRSVAISGDTAIVGAYGDDDAGWYSGSATVFTRSGSSWTQGRS